MDSSPADFLNGDPHNWGPEAAACQLVSPLELFADWLYQQPEPVQEGVAFAGCTVLRTNVVYQQIIQVDPASTDWLLNLTSWLACVPDDPEQTLGGFLLVRAAIDLLAFQHLATPDDHLLHREEMAALRAKAEQHGNTAAVDILTEPPEEPLARARMWITAADSWRKLRASVLGDEALSTWHEIIGWQQG